VYPRLDNGTLDLRPKRPVQRSLTFAIGTDRPRPDSFEFTYPMPRASDDWVPQQAWDKLTRPNVSLLTYIPRPIEGASVCLDLGCGSARDRTFVEELGYQYIGCDPFDTRAPVLADGHALPFRNGSVSVVLAMQVMEHFQNPFVAAAEVKRVLAPGGRFIGTVEQLVPFHMDSFYNMTRFGIFNTLAQVGLEPICISPSTGWTGIGAHFSGTYWPGVPRPVRNVLAKSQDRVSRVLHVLRARVKRGGAPANEKEWFLKYAGGFKFVAERPAQARPKPQAS
jgi:SAM-dependent methyltransferase